MRTRSICSLPDCGGAHKARGLCHRHYWRWQRRTRSPGRRTELQRWAAKVKLPTTPDGCWEWTGALHHGGHGEFRVGRRMVRAHRFGYETFVGPIPDGMDLDHFRLNPGPRRCGCMSRCVNPEHVEPVTHRENILRGTAPSARNARATHCPAGHSYDETNTYRTKEGYRRCRSCNTETARRLRSRRLAA